MALYRVVPHQPYTERYSAPFPVEGPDGSVYDFNREYDAQAFAISMNEAFALGVKRAVGHTLAGVPDEQLATFLLRSTFPRFALSHCSSGRQKELLHRARELKERVAAGGPVEFMEPQKGEGDEQGG